MKIIFGSEVRVTIKAHKVRSGARARSKAFGECKHFPAPSPALERYCAYCDCPLLIPHTHTHTHTSSAMVRLVWASIAQSNNAMTWKIVAKIRVPAMPFTPASICVCALSKVRTRDTHTHHESIYLKCFADEVFNYRCPDILAFLHLGKI